VPLIIYLSRNVSFFVFSLRHPFGVLVSQRIEDLSSAGARFSLMGGERI
jgi:hypothetical protein